jgi:hypothetical protein
MVACFGIYMPFSDRLMSVCMHATTHFSSHFLYWSVHFLSGKLESEFTETARLLSDLKNLEY